MRPIAAPSGIVYRVSLRSRSWTTRRRDRRIGDSKPLHQRFQRAVRSVMSEFNIRHAAMAPARSASALAETHKRKRASGAMNRFINQGRRHTVDARSRARYRRALLELVGRERGCTVIPVPCGRPRFPCPASACSASALTLGVKQSCYTMVASRSRRSEQHAERVGSRVVVL